MMKKKELLEEMKELELLNQELMDEIMESDHIMRKIGFSNGLSTVKAVAAEMVANGDIFELEE